MDERERGGVLCDGGVVCGVPCMLCMTCLESLSPCDVCLCVCMCLQTVLTLTVPMLLPPCLTLSPLCLSTPLPHAFLTLSQQCEMQGDVTSQRRWEAYDKLGTFFIYVIGTIMVIQVGGCD